MWKEARGARGGKEKLQYTFRAVDCLSKHAWRRQAQQELLGGARSHNGCLQFPRHTHLEMPVLLRETDGAMECRDFFGCILARPAAPMLALPALLDPNPMLRRWLLGKGPNVVRRLAMAPRERGDLKRKCGRKEGSCTGPLGGIGSRVCE